MKEEAAAARPEKPDIMVEYLHLDLSSYDSIGHFVAALSECNRSLHVLINNAATFQSHYGRSFATGFSSTMLQFTEQ